MYTEPWRKSDALTFPTGKILAVFTHFCVKTCWQLIDQINQSCLFGDVQQFIPVRFRLSRNNIIQNTS